MHENNDVRDEQLFDEASRTFATPIEDDVPVEMSDDEIPVEGENVRTISPEAAAKNDALKRNILTMEKTVYDFQALRIAMGNRIVAANRPDLVKPPAAQLTKSDGTDELSISPEDEKKAKEAEKFLAVACKEYRLVTDAYVELSKHRVLKDRPDSVGNSNVGGADVDDDNDDASLPSSIVQSRLRKALDQTAQELSIIKDELTYRLVRSYEMAQRAEKDAIKALSLEVVKHPLWDDFLKDVTGCGPMMAAVIISEFDIHKARHVSSLWKYAGLDVLPNGEGRSRYHYEMVKYTDRNGNVCERKSLGYKPALKSKLLGVLGSGFLRAGQVPKNVYGKIYYDYKYRLQQRPDLKKSRFGVTCKANGVLKSVLPVGTTVKAKDVVAVIEKSDGKTVGLPAKLDGMITEVSFSVGDVVPEKTLIVQYEVDLEPKARIHRMAVRYAVKMFLRDLWIHWRALEGYDVSNPDYAVEFLHRNPHGYNEATDGPAATA